MEYVLFHELHEVMIVPKVIIGQCVAAIGQCVIGQCVAAYNRAVHEVSVLQYVAM